MKINLPKPEIDSQFSLAQRRSIRQFINNPLSLGEISQLLWAAQNVRLQTVALGLGTAPIGAFRDELVKQTLKMKNDETFLCLLPVGKY